MATTEEVKQPGISFVYAYQDRGNEEANQQKDWFAESIRKTYPEAFLGSVSIYGDPKHFMSQRVLAYSQIRNSERGTLCFLDTDVLALRRAPFERILSQDFDIALVPGRAENPYLLMPYCGHFILSKDTPKAHEWFQMCVDVAQSLPIGMVQNDWWIDQLAMAYAAEHVPGLKVVTLPFDKFNFLPEGPQATQAYFAHFKGPRKQYMRQYYRMLKGTDYA